MERVEVDGSQGEGGGQILRTAVAFAVIKQVAVRVVKIRAGRDPPGLKRQHLSALKVLASVFGGVLEGAEEGSTTIRFVPGSQRLQSHSADMGTAASITLVLQAVIPAVAIGGSRLRLELTGGTDVPWSPTFDYFQSIVLSGYRAIGIEAGARVTRRGYYPRGGGKVTAEIAECRSLNPIDMTSRPQIAGAAVASRCGMLPKMVAERQARAAEETLAGSGVEVASTEATEEESSSPGTSVLVGSVGDRFFIGGDALGKRGKPAEDVGREAAEKYIAALNSGACMDANVADMVVPLLSLASGPSLVRVQEFTPHLESGLRLAERFTSCSWTVERDGPNVVLKVFPRTA
ncbi:MAG: RNA 3'-terminal phosphate cyclase [Nitrososphaerota archaeon]|nr:RNA 3'-terminal phosphate cyclase [Nitrososphaerota archaeon]MDG6990303.1 RNA 3'-terminal phosphate cyclase [Nitrososphaerota archaeon]